MLLLLHRWESDTAPLEILLLLIFLALRVRRGSFYALGAGSHYYTWIPALGWSRGRGWEGLLPSVQEAEESRRAAGQGHPAPRDTTSCGMKYLDLDFCSKSRAPCHLDMDLCEWSSPTILPSLQGQVHMGPSGHLVCPALCS